MRTSESGAPVLRKSSDAKRISRPPKPPGVKPPPKGQRWSGSLEELAARKRATQERAAAKASAGAPQAPPPTSAEEQWPLPSAPPSVKARLSALYRNQRCDRPWQIPCWLASLLLHLLAVVLLGSLTVPVSRNRTVVSLLLTFGDFTATADEAPVELAAVVSEPVPVPTLENDGGDALPGLNEISPPETGGTTEVPSPRDQSETPDAVASTDAAGNLPGETPPGQAEAQGAAEITRASDTEAAHDDVVERFIQFDIGKLQGDEGARARDDFQRLGSDALPSLVRGLNRSAMIRASCPVMVITSKIEAVLRENPDPELLKYAIDNIGRGVPSHAPHRGRLRTLLAQLRRAGAPQSSPNVAWVEAQLKSQDRQQIANAAETVVAQCAGYSDMEKRDIAWDFIRLLHHRFPNVRDAAHQALVALAGGEDYGPDDDRQTAERFTAAGAWSRHFDAERYEATAAAALKNGEHLADAGKRDAARRQYQKVSQEYPGTAAADDAAKLLETPKSFAFK